MRFFGPMNILAILAFFGVTGAYVLLDPQAIFAQVSGDGIPPKITNVGVGTPTATSTLVTWETNEPADSEVNYGLDKNYGTIRDPLPTRTKHKVLLTDLEPSTVYHLRVGSHDEGGNQSLSGDYIFTTKGVINIKDIDKIPVEDQATVERAVSAIKKIKTAPGLQVVADALGETAEEIISAPRIIGPPRVSKIDSDSAEVTWATDQESGSVVEFARETEYRPDGDKPYTTLAGDSDVRTQEHSVVVEGLSPGTLYHFRVQSAGEFGLTGESKDETFTTKALLPKVSNFRVIKVEEDSATLSWRTDIPAAGLVEYTNTGTREVKSAGSPVFASTQTVKVAGLRLGNRYRAVVNAENSTGEKSISDPIFFTTVKDIAPPTISRVSNESTLYPSADAKVQTIVSWATDESAFCQFIFREGLNPTIEPTGLGEEKEPRSTHVQVVTQFLPSTAYQFWIECRDDANNKAKSENFVLFTPNKEKSIIDIILENFEGTFGWVKNVGK